MSNATGDRNGLNPGGNLGMTRVEPLITPKQVRERYLFGVHTIDGKTGKAMTDETLQSFINTAVSWVEHYLDISITPVNNYVENLDYDLNDYIDWGYIALKNYPVQSITSMKMVYQKDEDGTPVTVQTIPNSWLRLQPHDGIVRFFPNNNFPANLQIGQGGGFFPEIMRSQKVPHLWQITYSYGFKDGQIPVIMNAAIGMLAAIQEFIVSGHLLFSSPGISGTSISLDGISQSVSTTASAENNGYSSAVKDYQTQLWGKVQDDPFAIMRILKGYYKSEEFTCL